MAFNLSALDNAVKEAVSVVDLVDKFANAIPAADIPVVGAEAEALVKAIDLVDKALHALQSAIGAA